MFTFHFGTIVGWMPTQEAAGDGVHVAPRLQRVQAQDDDVELLVKVQRLLLDAGVVWCHRHARHAAHHLESKTGIEGKSPYGMLLGGTNPERPST